MDFAKSIHAGITMRAREIDQFDPVLIVDDRWEDVFLLQRLLRSTKTTRRVCTAGGGPEAIRYFVDCIEYGAQIPALVLLDISMPTKDGFDVLRWIRQHEAFKHVVVVMLSVSDDPADISKAQELGAQGYLAKYPSSQTLAEILELLTLPSCLRTNFPGHISAKAEPDRGFNRL